MRVFPGGMPKKGGFWPHGRLLRLNWQSSVPSSQTPCNYRSAGTAKVRTAPYSAPLLLCRGSTYPGQEAHQFARNIGRRFLALPVAFLEESLEANRRLKPDRFTLRAFRQPEHDGQHPICRLRCR